MPEARAKLARPRQSGVARWLHLEQRVNEPIHNDAVFAPIHGAHNGVLTPYRSETAGAWAQEHVLVDASEVRAYGPVRRVVEEALGLRVARDELPLFVHPQSRGLFGDALGDGGLHETGVTVSPTASCRSLVAWRRGRPPWVLKLGIDTRIGGRWRGFEEHQIARAVILSRLLRTMPKDVLAALRLDFFDEVCGAATDVTGVPRDTSGWLLRRLPRCLRAGRTTLWPLFSLVSRVGREPSMLTRMIREERADPTDFAIRRVLAPLVRVYSYLAFVEGLLGEMHVQNILYEVGADGALTGRVVLRDVTDVTLNVPLRVAQGRPLPAPTADVLPENRSLELAWITTEPFIVEWTGRAHRANLCVCGHGLQGSTWVVHRGLRAAFPGVRLAALKRAFVTMWRNAARHYLGVDPIAQVPQGGWAGLPVDEAVRAYLSRADWKGLGARPCRVPSSPRVRWIGNGPKRRLPSRALALDTAWGEVFIVDGAPRFFRPAF